MQVQFICCTVQLNYGNMSWTYHEKSTFSSCISLSEKDLQTTRSALLHACRFTTYECLPPLLILRSHFIVSRKYYLLVKQSQLLRVHPCLRLMLFNEDITWLLILSFVWRRIVVKFLYLWNRSITNILVCLVFCYLSLSIKFLWLAVYVYLLVMK